MKVLHEVITMKAYEQAKQRSEMNHKTEQPAVLFYGKGRHESVIYTEKGEVYKSKCSFYPQDVIPFDLNLLDDLRYFKNSHRTFIKNIKNGQNYSVKICEVDLDGNFIREIEESEVLALYKD